MTRPARYLAVLTLAWLASGTVSAQIIVTPTRPPDIDYRIVYVLDFSANVTDSQRAIITNQIVSTLHKLRPTQNYSILVMGDGKVSALSDLNLTQATKDHVKRAVKFLNEAPRGGDADAEVAINKALALKPSLAYMYASGPLKNLEAARKLIADYQDPQPDKNNKLSKFGAPPKPLKIHTAMLFNNDAATATVLKEIADLRHGKSVFISADDLANDPSSAAQPTTRPTTRPTTQPSETAP